MPVRIRILIFIKYGTKESEIEYKKYKNKLTNFMRVCTVRENIKSNVKSIWNIWNNIRKRQTKADYSELFTDSDTTMSHMNEVVDR